MTRAAAFALAVIAAAACQIERRTDDLHCTIPADCTGGAACVDGWCVGGDVPDAASGVDAPAGTPDAEPAEVDAEPAFCPSACTSCVAGTCVIECDGMNACPEVVVCPDGMPCEVECSGTRACANGVECADDRCTVACSGDDSCDRKVKCQNACACDVTCTGAGSCPDGSDCPGPNPCDTGDGCTSSPGACDLC